MQKYVDQAIFDSGVLVLAIFGVLELKRQRSKFDIESFLNFQGMLAQYESIRPDDRLYRPQSLEALEWLLGATPISLNPEEISPIYKTVYDVRKELNAEMKPPSFRERILRGAIFQPESKDYVDRVRQSKINILKILLEVSRPHNEIFKKLPDLDRSLTSATIRNFIARSTESICASLHKPYREDEILWETKFHFACSIATAYYLSVLRRFDSFPSYSPETSPKSLSSEIKRAICEYAKNNISSDLAERVVEFYIADQARARDRPKYMDEQGIWENMSLSLTLPPIYSDDDDDVNEFLCIAYDQITSYDIVDSFEIDSRRMGLEFLGS
jgi:hypothetical protein